MKLTKKKKEEVLEIYTIWLHSYLNGDVATYHQYLDDAYHFIGSTNNEEFLDRNATTNFFEATADQLAGKCQLKEEKKTVEAFGDLVFITHVFDAWFLNGSEWTYYSRFRFSSVMQEKKTGWRFIYQHFSTTDNKADAGETIGFDKVTLENQELREAIKRRTVELEAKNREQEIEAALERVRSRSMAMHTSDELEEVSALLDNEVRALGIKTWGCAFNIYGEKDSSEWFSTQAGVMPPYKTPRENIFKKYYNIGQQGETFHIQEFKGKKCVAHYEYLCTLPEAGEALRDIKKSGGSFPEYQIDHVAYFKQGYLLFITLNPFPEAHEIFKRFAKVFEQTYTRFLDLQKAEAQAREAQIEAALERVRSASMAMHKTEDLSDVVMVYFEQLKHLDIDFIQSWITIFHLDKGYVDVWFSPLEGIYDKPRHFKMPSVLFENTSIKSWKAGLPFSYVSFPNKENVDEFMQVCDDVTNSNYFGKTQNMLQLERFEMVDANHKYGCISKSNTTKASEEDEVILQRFANVFEQTYTRFLDLQKAEAQAREKEIELALEKVRSRTMAMQTSEELEEVILEVLKKLQGLGISMEQRAAAIFTYEAGNKGYKQWVASPEYNSILSFDTPYFDHPVQNDIWNARQNGTDFYAKPYPVEVKNALFQYMFDLPALKNMPKAEKTKALKFKHYAISIAFQKHAALVVVDHSGIPLTEAENSILIRLSKVFNQTYTRFLDLQKAEEQAREAQIEAALEKVRSRSLAMHNPEELQEVVAVVAKKLKELGVIFDAGGVILCTYFPDNKDVIHWISVDDFSSSGRYFVPYFDNPIFNDAWDSKMKGDAYFSKAFPAEAKNEFFKHAFANSDYRQMPEDYKQFVLQADSHNLSAAWSKNSAIIIPSLTGAVPSVSDAQILTRFAKVFEQAYIRFLDLKKAEAQAREAQIEGALERVRSRSLAMHNSEELLAVIEVVSEQLRLLDLKFDTISFGKNYQESDFKFWLTSSGQPKPVLIQVPFFDSRVLKSVIEAQKKEIDFIADVFTKEENRAWSAHMIQFSALKNFPEHVKDFILNSPGFARSSFLMQHIDLYVGNYRAMPFTDEENAIFKRFAQVFSQAYTRFLDLQKAEDQARESQIQLSLERVRAKSMAMQSSSELETIIQVVHDQFVDLGITLDHAGFIIDYKSNDDMIIWLADEHKVTPQIRLPYFDSPHWNSFITAKKQGHKLFVNHLDFKTKNKFYKQIFKYVPELPEDARHFYLKIPSLTIATALIDTIGLYIENFSGVQYQEEDQKVLLRFGEEFQQAYTRFLDLQKAEAQARETQIQLSLERVRAKSMAMQSSDELHDVIGIVFQQFDNLAIQPVNVFLSLFDREKRMLTYRASGKSGKRIPTKQDVDIDSVAAWTDLYNKWINDSSDHIEVIFYPKEIVPDILNLLKATFLAMPKKDRITTKDFPNGGYSTLGYTPFGYLGYDHTRPPTEEEKDILKRICTEFGRVYQRFLDIKKAEAQAREAQIEAALEKVRSRTMAMRNSDELLEIVAVLYEQIIPLGIASLGCELILCDEQNLELQFWSAVPEQSKLPQYFPIPKGIHPFFLKMWQAWKKKTPRLLITLKGSKKEEFDTLIFEKTAFKNLPESAKKSIRSGKLNVFSVVTMKYGLLEAADIEPLSEEKFLILERFAKVFEQTYTRFLDLQTAEKNAYKNKVEAALERVRSRAMAMQEPEELKDVAHILRTEMGLLGIEELETCSIYILDKKVAAAECWYAIKENSKNKKLVADHISMDFNATWVGKQMLEFHDSKTETSSIIMKGDKRKEWITYCMAQSKVLKDVYSDTIPDRTYHLQKFSHGAIGAASAGDISAESWALLKRSASVFSLAYARFKDLTQARIDLKKLKTAKKSAEEALSELQQTQTQLIQSEKMASLGELTAGIAHEIQNPLNFVNNFSEVSKELLEEMKEEIENGDFEEVKAIMDDVIQNLEKINHHGKRADGIVKGMLQHSRSSSGTKEPTDINALADEYLRLAYHGLRAKDKSFNATLETDFDESIGTINVLPQDMGRVILNLITNAFYASNERKQASKDEAFKPTVSVSTKKLKDTIEISVKDNGNGIPKEIVDKIFQPFFTTKPTGQGTGLGLSMSYDIVTKGHGGSLTVVSSEGKGSEFSITLPVLA